MTEDDLEFIENRQWSPQWIVKLHGREVAVVTERFVVSPPFNIRWTDDGSDEAFEDREAVVARLMGRLGGEVTA